MINFALMRHWQNWATVLLMVMIAFFAVNSLSKVIVFNSQEKK